MSSSLSRGSVCTCVCVFCQCLVALFVPWLGKSSKYFSFTVFPTPSYWVGQLKSILSLSCHCAASVQCIEMEGWPLRSRRRLSAQHVNVQPTWCNAHFCSAVFHNTYININEIFTHINAERSIIISWKYIAGVNLLTLSDLKCTLSSIEKRTNTDSKHGPGVSSFRPIMGCGWKCFECYLPRGHRRLSCFFCNLTKSNETTCSGHIDSAMRLLYSAEKNIKPVFWNIKN